MYWNFIERGQRKDVLTRLFFTVAVAVGAASLSGCPAVIIGGAAGTAAVAADSRTTGSLVEDQSIELKAAKVISDDKNLADRVHINITSYNQIVLVTGEAPTPALKQKLIDIVRRIEKVRLVHDEVAVMQPSSLTSRSSDSLITAKVKTKLFSIENFDATRVKVVTERGIVYLMGLVDKKSGDVASEAARTVDGVQRVVKLFEYTS